MDHVKQITIVGTGLLGASCGLGLRAAGFAGLIVGVGRRIETPKRARRLGAVDTATTDLGPAVRNSQLVILATPLSSFAPLLEQLAKHLHEGLVITDVGSTKQQVCADARRLLPTPSHFVGSHPMAGSEQHGPDAARADLFHNKPCIITPEADTLSATQQTVEALWTMLKMRVLKMSPAQHDHQTARISHLPHALSVLLVELAAKHDALDLASTGFRDTTRLASGDPKVWLDIFATNHHAIAQAIDEFTQRLTQFRNHLTQGDQEAILQLLQQNKQTRDAWVKSFESTKNV